MAVAKAKTGSFDHRIEYSAKEVTDALQPLYPEGKLDLARLNYYKREGVVIPTGKTTTSHGVERYRFNDVLALAFYLEMRKSGFKICHLAESIAEIQVGKRLRKEPWVLHQKHGHFSWWFRMDDLEARVKKALEKPSKEEMRHG